MREPASRSSSYRASGGGRTPGLPRGASARASARDIGGAAGGLERPADRGAEGRVCESTTTARQVVIEGGRLRGDGRADDDVPGGRGGREAR